MLVVVQQNTGSRAEAGTVVRVHYKASSRAAEQWYTCVRMLVGMQQNGGWRAFDRCAAG